MIKGAIIKVFFLIYCFNTFSQYTHIPDSNFENALIFQGIDDILDGQVLTANIENLESLSVMSWNISSLVGIEDFTALKDLWVSDNNLSDLNLSQNIYLEKLFCAVNNISKLDLTNNINLERISCSQNNLTILDVSTCVNLDHLNCDSNQMQNLDMTNNSQLTYLSCNSNLISVLDVSQNPEITHFYCQENQINSLDVSNLSELFSFHCSVNNISEIDVSNNLLLETFGISDNNLTEIDVSNNELIDWLDVSSNNLSDIDLSNNPLIWNLQVGSNPISSLDISNNLEIILIGISDMHISSLDLSNHVSLTSVEAEENEFLTQINIANGFNENIYLLRAWSTPNLVCIQVDDLEEAIIKATETPIMYFVDDISVFSKDCFILGNSEIQNSEITIYPNPVKDLLTIENESMSEIISITIYDVLGRIVLAENQSFEYIDVSALDTGLFLVNIETEQGIVVRKIVKE